MQITLVQSELEEAIRQYIGNQLTISNGSTMEIELSATRGSDGFKAVVDIQPAKRQPQAQTQQPQAAPTPRAAPLAAAPDPSVSQLAAVLHAQTDSSVFLSQENQPETAVESTDQETSVNTLETADTHASESPLTGEVLGQAHRPENSNEAPAPAAGGATNRSLFGGLKRPHNRT